MSAGGLLEKSAIGKREDLANLIANADVKTCPVSAMIKKAKKPGSTFFEWQLDAYAAPKAPGTGKVSGADISDFENAQENRAQVGNYISYLTRSGKVDELSEEVAVFAGESSPIGTARLKKVKELNRDLECNILGEQEMQADDGSVPYVSRGLGKFIQATAQSLNPIPAAFRPASAQIITTATADLTEDGASGTGGVQTLLKEIFDATGMSGDYKFVCGSTLRRAFTDFTRCKANSVNSTTKVRTLQGDLDDSTISSTTTIFHGDFGSVEVITSSWIALSSGAPQLGDGYLLDMDQIELRQASLPNIKPLPDLGGGPRFWVECKFGLCVKNPKGLGKFTP